MQDTKTQYSVKFAGRIFDSWQTIKTIQIAEVIESKDDDYAEILINGDISGKIILVEKRNYEKTKLNHAIENITSGLIKENYKGELSFLQKELKTLQLILDDIQSIGTKWKINEKKPFYLKGFESKEAMPRKITQKEFDYLIKLNKYFLIQICGYGYFELISLYEENSDLLMRFKYDEFKHENGSIVTGNGIHTINLSEIDRKLKERDDYPWDDVEEEGFDETFLSNDLIKVIHQAIKAFHNKALEGVEYIEKNQIRTADEIEKEINTKPDNEKLNKTIFKVVNDIIDGKYPDILYTSMDNTYKILSDKSESLLGVKMTFGQIKGRFYRMNKKD